jgi:signal transduction histidine kinase
MKISSSNDLINKNFLQVILPFPRVIFISVMISVCAFILAWISGFVILYFIAAGLFLIVYLNEAYRLSEKFDHNEQYVVDEKTNRQRIAEKEISGKQLQEALEKAREGERLKKAFLNNLSHELRTPLNAIVGYSAFLKEPGQSADQIDRINGVIQESSDILLDTINDLIYISSIESGKIEIYSSETDIGKLIITTVEKHRKKAKIKGVEINYSIDAGPSELSVMTDGGKLGHVLNHVIDNAVKFTDAGSVNVKCSKNGDWLQLRVSDSGAGIDPALGDMVFEPFFQAEQECSATRGGLGIGLAISRAFIKALGGDIWHKPGAGSGTDFF